MIDGHDRKADGIVHVLSRDITLYHTDCRAVLPTLVEGSIDACVCDPPYELGFMGKEWDRTGIAYNVAMWRMVYRALRPGAHLLAFGGSRTYHRLACAVEDAGFEIRDQIMWLYGSGFPKSLDVSKAVDRYQRRDYVATAIALGMEIPGNNLHDWTKAEHSPSDSWWADFKAYLSDDQWRTLEREVIGSNRRPAGWFTSRDGHDITASATEAAKKWDGWGSALKPAHEPIVMARKPLEGTIAENVLRHGTGALNIDGCRIEGKPESVRFFTNKAAYGNLNEGWTRPWQADPEAFAAYQERKWEQARKGEVLGRWPANLITDGSPEVLAAFAEYGTSTSRNGKPRASKGPGQGWGMTMTGAEYDDSGTPARFYYCAKASREDRNEGLEDFPAGNNHSTVKPTDLMRYLCRLVTPPGGVVLDPFLGSGSTGKAAVLEGFRFVGMESDTEHGYFPIARARVAWALQRCGEEVEPPPEEAPRPARPKQGTLFGLFGGG